MGKEGGIVRLCVLLQSENSKLRRLKCGNDIALMASGYLLTRLGLLVAFGYLFYRILRPAPGKDRVHSQSEYARERSNATRLDR